MALQTQSQMSWPETHFDARETAITERDFAFTDSTTLGSSVDWPFQQHIETGLSHSTTTAIANDLSSSSPAYSMPPPAPPLPPSEAIAAESSAMAAARAEALQKLVDSTSRSRLDTRAGSSRSGTPRTSGKGKGVARAAEMIRSMRQSRMELPLKRTRWYETVPKETTMTFRFVLTPRSGAAAAAAKSSVSAGKSASGGRKFTNVLPASEDGSYPDSAAGVASSVGSDMSGGGGIPLSEFARGDLEGFQKLLACSMFMMKDLPDKTAPVRPLPLNVLQKDGLGKRGTMLAMKHEKGAELEKKDMVSGMKRVVWRVRVKPV